MAYCVKQSDDGGFIIVGETRHMLANNSNILLLKTDNTGNQEWTKEIGDLKNDIGRSVVQTSDGGYALCYSANAISPVLQFTAGAIKTDANGNIQWSKKYGALTNESAVSINRTKDEGLIISGFTGSFNLDGSTFLIKTDSTGNSGCYQVNDTNTMVVPVVQVFSPSTSVNNYALHNTNGSTFPLDITLSSTAQLLCNISVATELNSNDLFSIYPNPATDHLSINFKEISLNATIQLVDLIGQTVFEKNISGQSELEINLSSVADGIYAVKYFDGTKLQSCKLIVKGN